MPKFLLTNCGSSLVLDGQEVREVFQACFSPAVTQPAFKFMATAELGQVWRSRRHPVVLVRVTEDASINLDDLD